MTQAWHLLDLFFPFLVYLTAHMKSSINNRKDALYQTIALRAHFYHKCTIEQNNAITETHTTIILYKKER